MVERGLSTTAVSVAKRNGGEYDGCEAALLGDNQEDIVGEKLHTVTVAECGVLYRSGVSGASLVTGPRCMVGKRPRC